MPSGYRPGADRWAPLRPSGTRRFDSVQVMGLKAVEPRPSSRP
ncbi:hypothetical protein FRAHR75_160073 [Frankia sp. Hr75.2]|nr:hypothetical protein FRAHR75_160073 [Frankia sp. Hr75.2]